MSDRNQPSLTEVAEQLLRSSNTGSLATHSLKHVGFPFASVVNYGVLPSDEPIFFLSSMATHSKNLKSDPRASLLVYRDGEMSSARATLIGTVRSVEPYEIETAKRMLPLANPEAEKWIGFGDFAFLKLSVLELYVVAGFGSMGWVKNPSSE